MGKILIIDAFAQLFRSYYALEKTGLSTSEGLETFAVYGFFKTVLKAVREIEPNNIFIALDSDQPSFRKIEYPSYKANRKATPESLLKQIDLLCDILKVSNLNFLMKGGLEADDIIATLANYYYQNSNNQIYIFSSDKDLAQLVNERTFLLQSSKMVTHSFIILDTQGVKEKYGVFPSQIIDYLSLVGDTADNVMGVPGVGTKTASKLLLEYSSIEGIYSNLALLKPTLREKMELNRDSVQFSQFLVTLKTDNSLIDDISDKILSYSQLNILEEYFTKLEFSIFEDFKFLYQLAKKDDEDSDLLLFDQQVIEKTQPQYLNEQSVNYYLVTEETDLLLLKNKILEKKLFVFDVETTSLDIEQASILGVSISLQSQEAFYISLGHNLEEQINISFFIMEFKDIFENQEIKKIGHNLKYDYKILKKYFSSINGLHFDTMIAEYVLNPDLKRYNLDSLALSYFNYVKISYSQVVNDKKNETLYHVAIEDVVKYACEDADISFRLYEIQKIKLKEVELESLFFDLEMPLIEVVSLMELQGICVDLEHFANLEQKFLSFIKELENSLYQQVGYEINLNSPKQVAQILYDKLKLTPSKKTKTGYSTDEQTLLNLPSHPFVEKLLEYRRYFKLLSTYIQSIPKHAVHKEGIYRIHTSFHQEGTATGRLSSSSPNLQNIPVKDKEGRYIREGFVATEGTVFISFDYSQIELRLLAHFSEDPYLIDAFLSDKDIHTATAGLIFNKKIQDVLDSERSIAKMINFGIIYGMGAQKLAKELKLKVQEAKDFIERYFEVFSGVKSFIGEVKKQAHQDEYVQTLYMRKRFLKDINSYSTKISSLYERVAVNSIIQGSNADIMKHCMLLWKKNFEMNQCSSLLLQVHDELVFEVKKKEQDHFQKNMLQLMEEIVKLKVPLKVKTFKGENWGLLK